MSQLMHPIGFLATSSSPFVIGNVKVIGVACSFFSLDPRLYGSEFLDFELSVCPRVFPLFTMSPDIEEWIYCLRKQGDDHPTNTPPTGDIRPVLRNVHVSPNKHQECSNASQVPCHPVLESAISFSQKRTLLREIIFPLTKSPSSAPSYSHSSPNSISAPTQSATPNTTPSKTPSSAPSHPPKPFPAPTKTPSRREPATSTSPPSSSSRYNHTHTSAPP
jgi:hypothetical protein